MRPIPGIAVLLASAEMLVAAASIARASPSSLELCHRAELAVPEAAVTLIERGLRRAQEAIASDPEDPVAHFALFCNLAKRLRMKRFHLGMIGDLRRLHQSLDRSLDLDPEYAEALAAKGALLYYTPGIVGGDVDEGERLLRKALELDPVNPARLVLVDLLTYRRKWIEARQQAQIWGRVSRTADEQRIRAGARAVLSHMCDASHRSDREKAVLSAVC